MAKMKYTEQKLGRHTKGFYEKSVKGFKAKYAGTCMTCKESVEVGQMVGWFSYGKIYHIECLNSPSD